MKNALFFILFVLPVWMFAQPTEGYVIYEQKIDMHSRLDSESEDMKAYIPEFQTSKVQLLFTNQESLFREYEDIEDFQEQSGNVRIQINRASAETYNNFAEGRRITQQEFFGKQFLIEAEHEKRDWKLTGESKEVQGYPCMKAVLEQEKNDEKRVIEAWFTTAIPVPAGPESLGQLPGLILEASVNDGEMVYTPVEIKLEDLEEDAIAAPRRGKKVTQEEYDQIVDEKMKEFNAEGGSGIRIIRRSRN